MAATELKNRPAAVAEANVTDLSVKVAEQVSEILKEAEEGKKTPKPVLAYRAPSPGVRYYF